MFDTADGEWMFIIITEALNGIRASRKGFAADYEVVRWFASNRCLVLLRGFSVPLHVSQHLARQTGRRYLVRVPGLRVVDDFSHL